MSAWKKTQNYVELMQKPSSSDNMKSMRSKIMKKKLSNSIETL